MKNLLVALALVPLMGFAQEKMEKTPKPIRVGFYLQPEMNVVMNRSRSPLHPPIYSKQRLGVSGGINFQFQVSNLLFLETGLGYGFKTFHVGYNQYGSLGDIAFIENNINQHEIQLPFLLGFKLKKNFRLAVGGELNTQLGERVNTILVFNDGSKEKMYNASPQGGYFSMSPSFNLSFGYDFHLGAKSSISLDAMAKLYTLTNSFNESRMSYGIRIAYNLGLR